MTTPNKSSRNQVGNSTRRSVALTADENCLSACYMPKAKAMTKANAKANAKA